MAGLHQNATLRAAAIIEISSHRDDLEDKLVLLRGLGTLLTQKHDSHEALIARFLNRTSAPSLQLGNFPHLARAANTIRDYLANVLQTRTGGTNILLYGIPGTGKTEFVKALSSELGADLFEIAFSDSEGDPISGTDRLKAYNLCQRILAQKTNALLMFDEIEDVFPSIGGVESTVWH